MEKTTKRTFKLFPAWQDEKEEQWLRQMAQQGWHLASLGLPGFYTFTRGEPRDVVYRLDFVTSRVDKQSYFTLFQDAGWEHVGTMGGWQYFRKPADAAGPNEIYTDPQSKVEKYRRLLGFLALTLPLLVLAVTRIGDPRQHAYPFMTGVELFILLCMLFVAYGFLRIALRIRELRKL